MNKIRPFILGLTLSALTCMASAQGGDVDAGGVRFEVQQSVAGKALRLNGAGVR